MSDHANATYDFCLRFFADLLACGVRHAVISPGSRSTPLALSARAAGLEVVTQLDERVGGFHALGQAKATGAPSVLICTSGTAGAHYLPAVIEAHHSGVPLIVCTADRPAELRTWGAGQTIDQAHMFGSNVRWFHEVPVPSEVPARHAGVLALRAASVAVHERGVVHLNWPFREPLEPPGALVTTVSSLAGVEPRPASAPSSLLAELAERNERGLIVVGPDAYSADVAGEIAAFGRRWGWPILADPASGLRTSDIAAAATLVTTGELLLASSAFTERLDECEVVVRVGSAPTSKAYRLWIEAARPARLALVSPGVEWADPTASATDAIAGSINGLFATEPGEQRLTAWAQHWCQAEDLAARAVDAFLAEDTSELGLAGAVARSLDESDQPATLMVSNSMPIRDLDIALRAGPPLLRVLANRGANGIDGIVSTAAGVAHATGGRTVVFLGDVAAVHDMGGLAAAARLGIENLTVVVVDNDAGGIFSFLPVAGVVDPTTFEELFAIPHGTNLVGVARALGFVVSVADTPSEFEALDQGGEGPRLVVVRTSAPGTVSAMAEVRGRVALALAAADS